MMCRSMVNDVPTRTIFSPTSHFLDVPGTSLKRNSSCGRRLPNKSLLGCAPLIIASPWICFLATSYNADSADIDELRCLKFPLLITSFGFSDCAECFGFDQPTKFESEEPRPHPIKKRSG